MFSLRLFFTLTIMALLLVPAAAQTRLPETPAGQRLGEYLKAFNSGDSKVLRGFMKNHAARPEAEEATEDKLAFIMKDLGKLEVFEVLTAEEQQVMIIAKAAKGKWVALWCQVEAATSHKITGFRLDLTSPPNGQK